MATRFEPTIEFFDRTAVPPLIAELWAEWPDLDAETTRLVRAAVSSRDNRRMGLAWEMLKARADLQNSGLAREVLLANATAATLAGVAREILLVGDPAGGGPAQYAVTVVS